MHSHPPIPSLSRAEIGLKGRDGARHCRSQIRHSIDLNQMIVAVLLVTACLGGVLRAEWCSPDPDFERHYGFLANEGQFCPKWGAPDDPGYRDQFIPTAATPIRTMRLRFHVMALNDGTKAAATASAIAAQVTRLNAHYKAARIQFEHTMRIVNSSKFRFVNQDLGQDSDMKSLYAELPDHQHNIYVTTLTNGLLGRSTFPWQPTAKTKAGGTILDARAVTDTKYATVLTHELGHALGLWHTHHGVREVEPCTACYEKPKRTIEEGDHTGDFCSDTAPTPMNYECTEPKDKDPCTGEAWPKTPVSNFMGYSLGCQATFSPQQMGRMHAWIEEELRGWAVGEVSLGFGEALDSPDQNWETSPLAGWESKTRAARDGTAAVVSPRLDNEEEAWIETTFDGPGRLSFWWKVSSEQGYDYLTLWVDGLKSLEISGEVDWEERSVPLSAGTHRVRWTYSKDLGIAMGDDRASLDSVVYQRILPPSLKLAVIQPGTMRLSCPTQPGMTYLLWVSNNMQDWSLRQEFIGTGSLFQSEVTATERDIALFYKATLRED